MKLFKIAMVLFLTVAFTGSSYAGVTLNGNSDPTGDLIKRMLVEIHRPLAEINSLTMQIRKAENQYGLSPILLIAVMNEENNFPGFPQAHAYLYNIDNGTIIPHENVTSLPAPFTDVDRVARALISQIETFDGDLETAVAAYFFGPQNMKHRTVAELDADGKSLILRITDFINAHPDDRPNPNPIKSSKQSSIAKPIQPASRSYDRNPGFGNADAKIPERKNLSESDKKKFSSIEEKYISVMRYFNKKLDKKTADEIYWAIATLHNQYPNVDARLVMALFAIESSFRPDAVSNKGAQGLGQLMPFTAENLNVDDPFNCSENIRGTYKYLDREFKRWADKRYTLDLVLAAYNAGPEAVKKHGNNIPPYKETQAYVRKVINIYQQLLLEDEKDAKLLNQTRFYTKR